MLSAEKLKKLCEDSKITIEHLAEHLVSGGRDKQEAISAVRNWKKGLIIPIPRKSDVENLASALGVEVSKISQWKSSYRYAPGSARKAGLIRALIVGRGAQDAMDILKFTRKRAAAMVNKVLKSAIADAEEQQADVENLYVSDVRVDDAGIRAGTKRFIEKDRGRAHRILQKACHITVIVTEVYTPPVAVAPEEQAAEVKQ
jgi:large subunit ribosomal protein L22